MKSAVSDEILHAFIDGELDVAESETLIARMQQDQVLAQRICALRSLRSMVKLAYAEPPVIDARPPVHRRQLMQRCAFGCLVLLVGLSSGWALRGLTWQAGATQLAAVSDGYRTVSLAREADPNRIILHIDSAAPEKMRAALDRADQLLNDADRQGRAMQLEVIANSHGLELLRAEPPTAPRGRYRYSDLNMLLLQQILERVTGRGLDVLVRDGITRPLGMTATGFGPCAGAAATEDQRRPWAKADRGMLRGVVHDENAWALGGVAGLWGRLRPRRVAAATRLAAAE